MIDPATGAVRFSDGATITRELTPATFAALPLDQHTTQGHNYVNVRLPPREMDGQVFGAQIYFRDDVLTMVILWIMDETTTVDGVLAYPPGKGWDTWTFAAVMAKKEQHDAWLRRVLGPPTTVDPEHYITSYDLPWGTAWSDYSPRDSSSTLELRYKPLSGDL